MYTHSHEIFEDALMQNFASLKNQLILTVLILYFSHIKDVFWIISKKGEFYSGRIESDNCYYEPFKFTKLKCTINDVF